jgi:hypothetical protein
VRAAAVVVNGRQRDYLVVSAPALCGNAGCPLALFDGTTGARLVDERTKTRNYSHRMMDYNNDPTTTLADVRSVFAEALARIKS